jgi:hypothetical protein
MSMCGCLALDARTPDGPRAISRSPPHTNRSDSGGRDRRGHGVSRYNECEVTRVKRRIERRVESVGSSEGSSEGLES